MRATGRFGLLDACLIGFAALAGCDDGTGLEGTGARAGRYHVGEEPTAPDPDAFADTPAAGEIAVDFGRVDVGTSRRRYLFVRNTGESALLLVGLDRDPDWGPHHFVRCPSGGQFVDACPAGQGDAIRVEPGDDLVLEIEYAPAVAGTDATFFELSLNATDHDRLRVRLTGEGVAHGMRVCVTDCVGDESDPACGAAGRICDAGLSIDFGELGAGESRTRHAWIQSAGERDLAVSTLRIEGDASQFGWQGDLPGILAAGEEAEIRVTCRPGAGGDHRATLRIVSDAGESEVALAGRMVAPRVCPDPLTVDFGNVEVGVPAQRTVTLTNCGLADLAVDDVRLAPDGSQDFALIDPPVLPAELAPAASLEVRVQYDPGQHGSDAGGLEIYSDDITSDPVTGLTGTIALWGNGVVVECQIGASPFRLEFGGVEAGGSWERELAVFNLGTSTCTIDEVVLTVNSADDEFTIVSAPAAGTSLDPGDVEPVVVRYAPLGLGPDNGEIEIRGDDADGGPVVVVLAGEGVAEATCDLLVQPTLLNFGAVEPHHTRYLEVLIRNLGPAPCHVTDLGILHSVLYDSDFEITAGPGATFDLQRAGEDGDLTTVEITFAPQAEGEHAGVLWLHTDDDPDFQVGAGICARPGWPPVGPQPGDACIPVSGQAKDSDLEVVPGALDFGVVTVGCGSPQLDLTVYNLGYFTIRVQSIHLDDPADPAFEIVSAPAPGYELSWGGSFQVGLRYHPQGEGVDINALVIETDDFDIPRMIVPLRGEGTHTVTQTDVFTQPSEGRSDVLFVVDNSESMGQEQEFLAQNFDHFIGWAVTQDADFQIGVITTMASGEEWQQGDPPRDIVAGELVAAPGRPRILANDTPDLAQAFAENVRVGTSPTASTEQGLEAARIALTPPKVNAANAGFLREEARLTLIFVSDENDQSGGDLDYYLDVFSALKGPRNTELFDITAVAGDVPAGCEGPGGAAEPCSRYIEAASLTGGVFESICTTDWGLALENIGLDAFAGYRDFPLTRPADPATIEVDVDGTAVARAACPGCPDGWTYYPDTNSVFFGEQVVPVKGARIQVTYGTVCAGG